MGRRVPDDRQHRERRLQVGPELSHPGTERFVRDRSPAGLGGRANKHTDRRPSRAEEAPQTTAPLWQRKTPCRRGSIVVCGCQFVTRITLRAPVARRRGGLCSCPGVGAVGARRFGNGAVALGTCGTVFTCEAGSKDLDWQLVDLRGWVASPLVDPHDRLFAGTGR